MQSIVKLIDLLLIYDVVIVKVQFMKISMTIIISNQLLSNRFGYDITIHFKRVPKIAKFCNITANCWFIFYKPHYRAL